MKKHQMLPDHAIVTTMDRLRLLLMDLSTVIVGITVSTIRNTKSKASFVRRLAVGFVILAILGLLYVPAYHSAQSPFSGLSETPSPAESPSSLHSLISIAQLPGWSYNTSRDLCVYIHPGNTTSILSPTGICSLPPYLLIIVCSAVANQEARIAIRSTWANKYNLDNLYNSTVKVAFLLGQSDNDTLNNLIVEESSQYNDIVQERFLDTYNNLTLKSVMMLKWVMSNCDQTKYLMKTDDDMFVNIPLLLQTLHPKTETLLGSLICNARPILDPKNKWYMPKYMYSEKTYPNYLSGTGYVMSMGVASKLYQAALVTPLLHLEDVYITGLCAKRAKVRPVNHPGFSYGPRKIDPCVLRNAITTHKVNASNMYVIWIKVNNASVICTNRTRVDRKPITLSRSSRNAGYYVFKKKTINRLCNFHC